MWPSNLCYKLLWLLLYTRESTKLRSSSKRPRKVLRSYWIKLANKLIILSEIELDQISQEFLSLEVLDCSKIELNPLRIVMLFLTKIELYKILVLILLIHYIYYFLLICLTVSINSPRSVYSRISSSANFVIVFPS